MIISHGVEISIVNLKGIGNMVHGPKYILFYI